jgi:hypothetical protein
MRALTPELDRRLRQNLIDLDDPAAESPQKTKRPRKPKGEPPASS